MVTWKIFCPGGIITTGQCGGTGAGTAETDHFDPRRTETVSLLQVPAPVPVAPKNIKLNLLGRDTG